MDPAQLLLLKKENRAVLKTNFREGIDSFKGVHVKNGVGPPQSMTLARQMEAPQL